MSAKERNELDEYSDLMDGIGIHNAKPADPDAEWLQQQQPAAIDAAREAGMFDDPAAAIDMQPNTIRTGSEMLQVLFADMDRILGDGKRSEGATTNGYYDRSARGE
jgi:hypothetical protein